jgi:N-methylhydantoinase A
VAICLLFSFLHPEHERRIQSRLRAALAHVDVLISYDIQPEFREFPRTSTTLFAAYVAPVLRNYVEKLLAGMREEHIDSRLFIFQSNGGVGRPELVLRNPATTLLSGPAGAVVGAAQLARTSGHPNLITIDMGGTSLDVCLLRNGTAEATTAREIGYFPVVTPMLDVHTVGAGGGSIVTLDEVGRLKVGPESASSDPGPACYGLGGNHATLTDVNLMLGYIDANDFAGGEVQLDPERAAAVIGEHIAKPLGIDSIRAASGIFKVAANQMAEAIRFVSVQRGADPRDFDLCAFGGGGPIHAFAIAQELGMKRIFIPSSPGLFSSGGIALADFTHDYSKSILSRSAQLADGALETAFAQLRERADADLDLEGVPAHCREFQRSIDIRYLGQSTEINVRIANDRLDAPVQLQAFIEEFHRQHEKIYTYAVASEPVEVVNLRLRAVGRVDKPKEPVHAVGSADAAPTSVRDVWFGDSAHPTRVYRREHLHPGARIIGPAIIQELSSATVVPPTGVATVDAQLNLVLELS